MRKNYKRLSRNRFKRETPLFKKKVFWFSLLGLATFIGFIYLIYFSDFFQIEGIEISGNQKILTEEIEKIFQNKANNEFLFFPTRSIFLADLKEGVGEVLEGFPYAAEVNANTDFPDKIKVEITEREPVAILLCEEKKFYLDKEGIIFEEVSNVEPVFVNISNAYSCEAKLGENVINKEQLAQILEIEPKLRINLGVSIKEFAIILDERLNMVTEEGWGIYFNLQEDVDWQLVKLKAVLEEKIPVERRGDLEYIELRFGNFAPFKYR